MNHIVQDVIFVEVNYIFKSVLILIRISITVWQIDNFTKPI